MAEEQLALALELVLEPVLLREMEPLPLEQEQVRELELQLLVEEPLQAQVQELGKVLELPLVGMRLALDQVLDRERVQPQEEENNLQEKNLQRKNLQRKNLQEKNLQIIIIHHLLLVLEDATIRKMIQSTKALTTITKTIHMGAETTKTSCTCVLA